MLKIDIQICFTTIPPMQNFIEIHQRPELLSSGGFRRLDRGIERPRLDRVNSNAFFKLSSISINDKRI